VTHPFTFLKGIPSYHPYLSLECVLFLFLAEGIAHSHVFSCDFMRSKVHIRTRIRWPNLETTYSGFCLKAAMSFGFHYESMSIIPMFYESDETPKPSYY